MHLIAAVTDPTTLRQILAHQGIRDHPGPAPPPSMPAPRSDRVSLPSPPPGPPGRRDSLSATSVARPLHPAGSQSPLDRAAPRAYHPGDGITLHRTNPCQRRGPAWPGARYRLYVAYRGLERALTEEPSSIVTNV